MALIKKDLAILDKLDFNVQPVGIKFLGQTTRKGREA